MILLAWTLSALVSLPPLFGWSEKSGPDECTLSDDIGYVIYSAVGSFFIPALIMMFVYFKIYQAAKQRARKTGMRAQVKSSDKSKVSGDSSITEHPGGSSCRYDNGGGDVREGGDVQGVVVEVSASSRDRSDLDLNGVGVGGGGAET